MAAKQNEIKELKFPANIRTRPGMYVGSVDSPEVIIREMIDNSIDEVLKDAATTIWVDYYNTDAGWRFVVADDGTGMPIKNVTEKDPDGNVIDRDITMAELAVGTLHAGSKFDKEELLSTGMNGVGVSATNALSSDFKIYCKLDLQQLRLAPEHIKTLLKQAGVKIDNPEPNKYYKLTFARGIKQSEDIISLEDEVTIPDDIKAALPSTITTSMPDPTIWGTTKAKISSNVKYLRYLRNLEGKETKYLINGKEDTEVPESYKHTINVRIQNPNPKPENWPGAWNTFMEYHVSFQPSERLDDSKIEASVNTLTTPTGKHIKIFDNCYAAAFESIFGDCAGHACMGIDKLIIMFAPEVSFSSQTKEKLDDIAGFVYNYKTVYPELVNAIKRVINDNYEEFQLLYHKILEYLKSVANLSKMQQLEAMIPLASQGRAGASKYVPIKLRDCTCKDRKRAELYVVEGNSALGPVLSARAGMDNIAVLPLRGKVKNTSGMDILDVLENNECYDMIMSMGAGVDDLHDIDSLRYGKFIIATDADPDGSAIAALILGLVIHHMKFLIEAGIVYIALTPLYQQNGVNYYQGEEDKVDFSKPLTRYKGLGEMNSNQLKKFLLMPETRKLFRVTPSNLEYAKALLSNTDARRDLMVKNGLISDNGYTFDEWVATGV